ncbi:MAG: methylenetetrahydrofolate reductase C-terminal domain-containing protein [Eggerthellaceae bacterium]|nr:methylenetetrahydrofolate reductase C-terminal domain-containing protein [Eggerthellaceae bacterium]
MENRLRHSLEHGEFIVSCELIPGRGALEAGQIRELEEGVKIWQTGRVHALSITDNPGGNPALLADCFARELLDRNITPLVHFSCKDRNRNQCQSQLYALQHQGIEYLLVMSGDYPVSGWKGRPRPVFDLDPVQLLQLAGSMNEGQSYQDIRGVVKDQPANFLTGAVVNPFKWTEAETITQYLKLKKKLYAGAGFIVSQVGFDARKMEELIWYLRDQHLDVPVIANIFILTPGIAKLMRQGEIPGCFISDSLMETIKREAREGDKGRRARINRAAKMLALARKLGYAGVHIGGFGLSAEILEEILDRADEFQDQWQTLAKELNFGKEQGFYLYEPDLASGLNASCPAPQTEQRRERAIQKGYGLSRFFHYWVLTLDKRFGVLLAKSMVRRERKKSKNRPHGLEHLSKTALYGCIDCGDCGLEPCAYSCPMAKCPKCQRNGPCGGSSEGWCEVYPEERYCIYFKAYYRLKKHGEVCALEEYISPPNNWDHFSTSSWSNYTHRRDNTAGREFLASPVEACGQPDEPHSRLGEHGQTNTAPGENTASSETKVSP